MIFKAINDLAKNDFKITHILWHQGETDAYENMSKDEYKHHFKLIADDIKSTINNVPIYIAQASWCKNSESTDILNAQLALSEEYDNIKLGSNTDLLVDESDRHGMCYFSKSGLDKHADAWIKSIFDKK